MKHGAGHRRTIHVRQITLVSFRGAASIRVHAAFTAEMVCPLACEPLLEEEQGQELEGGVGVGAGGLFVLPSLSLLQESPLTCSGLNSAWFTLHPRTLLSYPEYKKNIFPWPVLALL